MKDVSVRNFNQELMCILVVGRFDRSGGAALPRPAGGSKARVSTRKAGVGERHGGLVEIKAHSEEVQ